jgi:hypothetical protein
MRCDVSAKRGLPRYSKDITEVRLRWPVAFHMAVVDEQRRRRYGGGGRMSLAELVKECVCVALGWDLETWTPREGGTVALVTPPNAWIDDEVEAAETAEVVETSDDYDEDADWTPEGW